MKKPLNTQIKIILYVIAILIAAYIITEFSINQMEKVEHIDISPEAKGYDN